jgi:hypothetical protein
MEKNVRISMETLLNYVLVVSYVHMHLVKKRLYFKNVNEDYYEYSFIPSVFFSPSIR